MCRRYVWTSDIVKDFRRRVDWQREVPPKRYDRESARTYCFGLSLGGVSSGWRLPTADELGSIVDSSRQNPSIDIEAFPRTPSEGFWTSTPYPGSPGRASFVSFHDGYSGFVDPTYPVWVRCVR